MADAAFSDGEWHSEDGLALHYRDYAGGGGRPPLLCLHALTRNARDFEPLAESFAGEWRMIVPEMRGRGQSEYARDAASYRLDVYAGDVARLLRQLDCGPVVAIGTSMGGLIAIALAAANAWPLAGVVLNDIGHGGAPHWLPRKRATGLRVPPQSQRARLRLQRPPRARRASARGRRAAR